MSVPLETWWVEFQKEKSKLGAIIAKKKGGEKMVLNSSHLCCWENIFELWATVDLHFVCAVNPSK